MTLVSDPATGKKATTRLLGLADGTPEAVLAFYGEYQSLLKKSYDIHPLKWKAYKEGLPGWDRLLISTTNPSTVVARHIASITELRESEIEGGIELVFIDNSGVILFDPKKGTIFALSGTQHAAYQKLTLTADFLQTLANAKREGIGAAQYAVEAIQYEEPFDPSEPIDYQDLGIDSARLLQPELVNNEHGPNGKNGLNGNSGSFVPHHGATNNLSAHSGSADLPSSSETGSVPPSARSAPQSGGRNISGSVTVESGSVTVEKIDTYLSELMVNAGKASNNDVVALFGRARVKLNALKNAGVKGIDFVGGISPESLVNDIVEIHTTYVELKENINKRNKGARAGDRVNFLLPATAEKQALFIKLAREKNVEQLINNFCPKNSASEEALRPAPTNGAAPPLPLPPSLETGGANGRDSKSLPVSDAAAAYLAARSVTQTVPLPGVRTESAGGRWGFFAAARNLFAFGKNEPTQFTVGNAYDFFDAQEIPEVGELTDLQRNLVAARGMLDDLAGWGVQWIIPEPMNSPEQLVVHINRIHDVYSTIPFLKMAVLSKSEPFNEFMELVLNDEIEDGERKRRISVQYGNGQLPASSQSETASVLSRNGANGTVSALLGVNKQEADQLASNEMMPVPKSPDVDASGSGAAPAQVVERVMSDSDSPVITSKQVVEMPGPADGGPADVSAQRSSSDDVGLAASLNVSALSMPSKVADQSQLAGQNTMGECDTAHALSLLTKAATLDVDVWVYNQYLTALSQKGVQWVAFERQPSIEVLKRNITSIRRAIEAAGGRALDYAEHPERHDQFIAQAIAAGTADATLVPVPAAEIPGGDAGLPAADLGDSMPLPEALVQGENVGLALPLVVSDAALDPMPQPETIEAAIGVQRSEDAKPDGAHIQKGEPETADVALLAPPMPVIPSPESRLSVEAAQEGMTKLRDQNEVEIKKLRGLVQRGGDRTKLVDRVVLLGERRALRVPYEFGLNILNQLNVWGISWVGDQTNLPIRKLLGDLEALNSALMASNVNGSGIQIPSDPEARDTFIAAALAHPRSEQDGAVRFENVIFPDEEEPATQELLVESFNDSEMVSSAAARGRISRMPNNETAMAQITALRAKRIQWVGQQLPSDEALLANVAWLAQELRDEIQIPSFDAGDQAQWLFIQGILQRQPMGATPDGNSKPDLLSEDISGTVQPITSETADAPIEITPEIPASDPVEIVKSEEAAPNEDVPNEAAPAVVQESADPVPEQAEEKAPGYEVTLDDARKRVARIKEATLQAKGKLNKNNRFDLAEKRLDILQAAGVRVITFKKEPNTNLFFARIAELAASNQGAAQFASVTIGREQPQEPQSLSSSSASLSSSSMGNEQEPVSESSSASSAIEQEPILESLSSSSAGDSQAPISESSSSAAVENGEGEALESSSASSAAEQQQAPAEVSVRDLKLPPTGAFLGAPVFLSAPAQPVETATVSVPPEAPVKSSLVVLPEPPVTLSVPGQPSTPPVVSVVPVLPVVPSHRSASAPSGDSSRIDWSGAAQSACRRVQRVVISAAVGIKNNWREMGAGTLAGMGTRVGMHAIVIHFGLAASAVTLSGAIAGGLVMGALAGGMARVASTAVSRKRAGILAPQDAHWVRKAFVRGMKTGALFGAGGAAFMHWILPAPVDHAAVAHPSTRAPIVEVPQHAQPVAETNVAPAPAPTDPVSVQTPVPDPVPSTPASVHVPDPVPSVPDHVVPPAPEPVTTPANIPQSGGPINVTSANRGAIKLPDTGEADYTLKLDTPPVKVATSSAVVRMALEMHAPVSPPVISPSTIPSAAPVLPVAVHSAREVLTEVQIEKLPTHLQNLVGSENPKTALRVIKDASYHFRDTPDSVKMMEEGIKIANNAGIENRVVHQLHADLAYDYAYGIGVPKNPALAIEHADHASTVMRHMGRQILRMFKGKVPTPN